MPRPVPSRELRRRSPGARPLPPRRRPWSPLVGGTVASAIVAAGLAGAGPATADVLRVDEGSPLKPTLFTPDGRRHDLASVPFFEGREQLEAVATRFSPDGTLVAVAAGSGVALVPADGGPARRLRGVDARTGAAEDVDPRQRPPAGAARLFAADVAPVLAWSADGTAFASGAVPDSRGRQVVRRCVVATLTCRVTAAGRTRPVTSLGDGRLVVVGVPPAPLRRLLAAIEEQTPDWTPRSAAWVRRARRTLARPGFDGLRIEAGPGGPATTLKGGVVPASRRVTTVQEVAPGGPASGAVLELRTSQVVLRTRRHHGRLEAIASLSGGASPTYVSVTADGRLRALPLLAEDSEPVVALPDGGWFGTALRHNVWMIPSRIDAGGRATTMRLGGREVTPARLHDALGLDRATRPPTRGVFDDGSWLQIVQPIGVEAATDSAIVGYDNDEGDSVVARLPLRGGPPTVVDRGRYADAGNYRSH